MSAERSRSIRGALHHGLMSVSPTAPEPRLAASLPFPARRAGTPNDAMPFDHVVVVMMENHSFDNLLGALPLTRAGVDGLTFDSAGNPTNSNPTTAGTDIRSFALPNTAQKTFITQRWKATHEQINGGRMDGFVRAARDQSEPMGYYTPEVLPFAYSLARTFTVAQPVVLLGTGTDLPEPAVPAGRHSIRSDGDRPPSVHSRLAAAAWHDLRPAVTPPHQLGDYFTDIPMTTVIPSSILKHLGHHHLDQQVLSRLRSGQPSRGELRRCPAWQLRDRSLASLPSIVKDALKVLGVDVDQLPRAGPRRTLRTCTWASPGHTGSSKPCCESPAWPRTLLIYTYDEHGGYYDHVPPPRAPIPDDISAGSCSTANRPATTTCTVLVSRRSSSRRTRARGGTSSVVYDHTSVLATIESKWNLPALTNRDANAATVMDFLDLSTPALLEPPTLPAPPKAAP